MKNTFTSPHAALLGSLSLTALSVVFSVPAEAVTVTVNGTDYNITTFNGSYNANTSRFSLAEMPWWGDESLATSFATALGGPNYQGLPENLGGFMGPLFAHTYESSISFVRSSAFFNGSLNGNIGIGGSSNYNYVVLQATPVPFESDALPLVGATLFMAGGLWWKKKRAQAKATDFKDFVAKE